MKKLVLSISMFLIAATTFAQSEVVTDSIPPISLDGYKNFNGFMLDMGSMIMAPPPLIASQLYYQPYNNNAIANYNEIISFPRQCAWIPYFVPVGIIFTVCGDV